MGERRVARNDEWTELDKFCITFTVAFLPLQLALWMSWLHVEASVAVCIAAAVFALVGHAIWRGLPPAMKFLARRVPNDDASVLTGNPYRDAPECDAPERDDEEIEQQRLRPVSLLYMRVIVYGVVALSAIASVLMAFHVLSSTAAWVEHVVRGT